MRRIDPSAIIQGQAFRYKRGTFEHLNQALQEQALFLAGSALPTLSVTPGVMTAIQGMNLTSTTVPVGAILYEGAAGTVSIPTYVWGASGNVAATSVTNWYTDTRTSWFWLLDNGDPTGPELMILPGAATGVNSSTPVWLVTGSYPVNPDADPVTFSNGNSLYVHQTRYLQVCDAADIDFSQFANQGYAFQLGTVGDIALAWQGLPITTPPNLYSVYGNANAIGNLYTQIQNDILGAWSYINDTAGSYVTVNGGAGITKSSQIEWKCPGQTMQMYFSIVLSYTSPPVNLSLTIPGGNTLPGNIFYQVPVMANVGSSGFTVAYASFTQTAGTNYIDVDNISALPSGSHTVYYTGQLTFDVQA